MIASGLGLALLSVWLAAPAMAAPSAQVFDAVKKPEALDPQWRNHLCALLPQPCNPQSVNLYRPRGAAANDFVALSEEPLVMARIQRDAGRAWRLGTLHDFRGYAASLKKEGDADAREPRLLIAPALYPLADGQWAAAVLQTVSEMYSGGGASFDTADFVPLDSPAKAAREGIPFACSKMIRACFSEKDYRHSKHCHDESSGSLRIAYGDAAQPGAPYDWQYTWLQSEWPQDTPQSATTTTRIRFSANTTERADFCGGPQ